ncbi:MAG TPA: T9SS type A sorting domain-containing protein [bacterium]|nr:T9SS type A sorting domain-containing protein [bacterium]
MGVKILRAGIIALFTIAVPAFAYSAVTPNAATDGGANDIHDTNKLWLYVNTLLNLGTYGFANPYSGNANYPGGAAEGNMCYGGPWVGSAAFGDARVMNYLDLWAWELDWSPSQPCVYWSDEATWNNVPKKMGPYSDLDSFLGADDRGAKQNRIGLAVLQHGMSWEKDPNRDFVLFKYYIYNRSGRDLDDLRVTFVYDFDILSLSTGDDDFVGVDAGRSMIYMYNAGPRPPYIGLRLVDGKASGAHGFVAENTPQSDAARWQEMLKAEWKKTEYAGDWVAVLNSGPYSVADKHRFSIGLAVVGGMSLQELQTHADAAYKKYWEIYTGLTDFTARAVRRGVALTWTPDRPYAGYNVYRAGVEAAEFEKSNASPVTGEPPFTYIDTGVSPNRTYAYKLEALTYAGHSEWFGPVEVETADTRKSSFAVRGPRPNPARDKAVFSVTVAAPCEVVLSAFDLAGRRVASVPPATLTTGEHDVALDTTTWPPGVYVYRVTAGDEAASGKMVVVR